MNRGSLDTGRFDGLLDSRFNEAPIHESGKSYVNAELRGTTGALQ